MRRAWLLGFLLFGCKQSGSVAVADADSDADSDSDTDTDTDADADSDSDADADSDADSDADTDPEFPVDVRGAQVECGDPQGQPPPMPMLQAQVSSNGVVNVAHLHHSFGCCPDLEVTAVRSGSTVDISYALTNDFCDCICLLDIVYRLRDLPSGTWTLQADGLTTTVDVP
jgi:hypothetical protein